MSTGVIITLIICGTLLCMSIINAVSTATTTKKASKHIDETFLKFFDEKEDK